MKLIDLFAVSKPNICFFCCFKAEDMIEDFIQEDNGVLLEDDEESRESTDGAVLINAADVAEEWTVEDVE